MESVLSGLWVEVTEDIYVFKVSEDVTEGGGALITIIVCGLAFLDQAVPVTCQPGEPGLAGGDQLLEELGGEQLLPLPTPGAIAQSVHVEKGHRADCDTLAAVGPPLSL